MTGFGNAPVGNAQSTWQASRYSRDGSFVPALGLEVLGMLDARAGERILDLGCGDGVLTRQIAQTGADVLGLDSSTELLAQAKAKGLTVEFGDGQALQFAAQFDAVFSNAAMHWMLDADAVARGVFAALKPGGRFVAEMGGFGNIAAILTALTSVMKAHGYSDVAPGQFYPTVEQYEQVASSAGFVHFVGQLVPRQTELPTQMSGWLRTFRQGFLDAHQVPSAEQEEIISDTVELLRPNLCDYKGRWIADYVRLRFTAFKPMQA